MRKVDLKNGMWFRGWSYYRDEPDPGSSYLIDLGDRYLLYTYSGYTEIPYEAISIQTDEIGEITEIHVREKKCLHSYMATLLLPGDTYEDTLDGMLWHLRDLTGLTDDEIKRYQEQDVVEALPAIRIYQYATKGWIKYRSLRHMATLTSSPGIDAQYLRGYQDAIEKARLWTIETDNSWEIGVPDEDIR